MIKLNKPLNPIDDIRDKDLPCSGITVKEKLIIDLVTHAPPVPDWFEPISREEMEKDYPPDPNVEKPTWLKWAQTKEKKRLAQWPWCYAKMVIDAMPKE